MRKIVFIVLFLGIMNRIFAQNTYFLFMSEQAVKAPSGHNTQPWLFKTGETEIEIRPDFTKSLPVVDPDNRELFVSLGCAAENLCIAASHKGYRTKVAIEENGIIRIILSREEEDIPSPLFSQLSVRQTNRSIYNGKIIPEDSIRRLKSIATEPCIGIHFFQNGSSEFEAISELIYEGNSRQMRDQHFLAELRQWMRYNKKHQNTTRDGLSYAVFGAPNLPRFISEPIISQVINEKSQNKNDRKKIASSSHFILFTTRNNTIEQWVNAGRTLERILLTTTAMGIVHAYMNQPNEIPELSRKMAEMLGMTDEYPTVLIRVGYGEKMPYSLRKSIEERMVKE